MLYYNIIHCDRLIHIVLCYARLQFAPDLPFGQAVAAEPEEPEEPEAAVVCSIV